MASKGLLLFALCAVNHAGYTPDGLDRPVDFQPYPSHHDVPAWVISLERTPLRYALFSTTSHAHKEFSSLEKHAAVDGNHLDIRSESKIALASRRSITTGERKSHSELATTGMAGLYISHVDVWKACVAQKRYGICIVFEDDALVPAGAGDVWDQVMHDIPKNADWDCWLLGVVAVLEHVPPHRLFPPGWTRVTNWFGTQAYAVTREGAAKLLQHAYPMTAQIDAYMAQMSALGEIVTIYRMDKAVDYPQFGVWSITTVQQLGGGCAKCDLPATWDRKEDEMGWQMVGIAMGAAVAMIPWGAITSLSLQAMALIRARLARPKQ